MSKAKLSIETVQDSLAFCSNILLVRAFPVAPACTLPYRKLRRDVIVIIHLYFRK